MGERGRVCVVSVFDSFGVRSCRRKRVKTEREKVKASEVIKGGSYDDQ